MGSVERCYREQADKTLREFNSDPSKGRTGSEPDAVKNSDGPYDEGLKWGFKFLKGGKRRARQPLPIHRRPSADNFWQRDPYQLDSSAGHHHYNRLDFLAAYNMRTLAGYHDD